MRKWKNRRRTKPRPIEDGGYDGSIQDYETRGAAKKNLLIFRAIDEFGWYPKGRNWSISVPIGE